MSDTQRKGIVLAGGSGTRLFPLPRSVSKQLLPVYDKPMTYYPLSVLMLADIRDILIITTQRDLATFRDLLGSGQDWGIRFEYLVQAEPRGIAQALTIGEAFLDGAPSALVLGDNLFFGQGFHQILHDASLQTSGATIFGYSVRDPQRYGVVEIGPDGRAISIEEKPQHPKSQYAIPGLYFYDSDAPNIARQLRPSARGELEITDVNRAYMERGQLRVVPLSRGFAWLDAGTHESLAEATAFIAAVEKRQSMKIGCPEEVAFRKGFISQGQLMKLAEGISNEYGEYLQRVASGRDLS
jgi:glucose-1-phosphate thymidylyltransferase